MSRMASSMADCHFKRKQIIEDGNATDATVEQIAA
jgi:hypothetical protein